jgi:hypothetical protein
MHFVGKYGEVGHQQLSVTAWVHYMKSIGRAGDTLTFTGFKTHHSGAGSTASLYAGAVGYYWSPDLLIVAQTALTSGFNRAWP